MYFSSKILPAREPSQHNKGFKDAQSLAAGQRRDPSNADIVSAKLKTGATTPPRGVNGKTPVLTNEKALISKA